jgi:hypothetical protein
MLNPELLDSMVEEAKSILDHLSGLPEKVKKTDALAKARQSADLIHSYLETVQRINDKALGPRTKKDIAVTSSQKVVGSGPFVLLGRDGKPMARGTTWQDVYNHALTTSPPKGNCVYWITARTPGESGVNGASANQPPKDLIECFMRPGGLGICFQHNDVGYKIYQEAEGRQPDVFECHWERVKPLLVQMGFHPFVGKEEHGDGDISYQWWEASDQTRNLLPGLGWECWVIHHRGVIWVLCHGGSNSEALVSEVARRLVNECHGRPLLADDHRVGLCPRNKLGWHGVEEFQQLWNEAEEAAKKQKRKKD